MAHRFGSTRKGNARARVAHPGSSSATQVSSRQDSHRENCQRLARVPNDFRPPLPPPHYLTPGPFPEITSPPPARLLIVSLSDCLIVSSLLTTTTTLANTMNLVT